MAEHTQQSNNGNIGDNDKSITDSLKESWGPIKEAGASAMGVAKEFTDRFREDRTTHAADKPEVGEDASLVDKAKAAAKDYGGSLRRAVEGTKDSESFNAAKDNFGQAYNATKDGVNEAVNTAQERRRANGATAEPESTGKHAKGADSVADPTQDIIDGEVISTEDNQEK